jgi:hypothetical protein
VRDPTGFRHEAESLLNTLRYRCVGGDGFMLGHHSNLKNISSLFAFVLVLWLPGVLVVIMWVINEFTNLPNGEN